VDVKYLPVACITAKQRNFNCGPFNQSQSQNETCIAPLTKLDSGAEQNNILKPTIKIKKKNIV